MVNTGIMDCFLFLHFSVIKPLTDLQTNQDFLKHGKYNQDFICIHLLNHGGIATENRKPDCKYVPTQSTKQIFPNSIAKFSSK